MPLPTRACPPPTTAGWSCQESCRGCLPPCRRQPGTGTGMEAQVSFIARSSRWAVTCSLTCCCRAPSTPSWTLASPGAWLQHMAGTQCPWPLSPGSGSVGTIIPIIEGAPSGGKPDPALHPQFHPSTSQWELPVPIYVTRGETQRLDNARTLHGELGAVAGKGGALAYRGGTSVYRLTPPSDPVRLRCGPP